MSSFVVLFYSITEINVLLKTRRKKMDIRGALSAGWNQVKTIPATLNEMRNGDNLLRICHIAIARISNSGASDPASGYTFSVAVNTYFFTEFLRSFRLPHMWLNKVNQESVEVSNLTVQDIIDVLVDPQLPSIVGLPENTLVAFRNDVVGLNARVRAALDTVLANGKGYSESAFKIALANKLAEAISRQYNNRPIQVDLQTLQIRYAIPRTYKDTAILTARTVHAIFMNMAILEHYGVYSFSNLMDKVGLKPLKNYFTTLNGNPSPPIVSSLIYTSFIIGFICTGIVSQMKLQSMRNYIVAHGGQAVTLDFANQRKYQAWTIAMSLSNAVLYTFALYGLEARTFFNFVQVIKTGELLGEIAFRYKLDKFST